MNSKNRLKIIVGLVLFGAIFIGLLQASKYEFNENENNQEIIDEITEDYIEENDYLNSYIPKMYENTNVYELSLKDRLSLFDSLPNGSPLDNTFVTDDFGTRIHPITKRKQFHSGIDLRAKVFTPVHATADGIVKKVMPYNRGNYGRMVVIYHAHGFETLYAHLRRTKVKEGDYIKKGDVIGLSGSSGRSTGPHLHYEVKYTSSYLNPKDFMDWNINDFNSLFNAQKTVPWDELIADIRKENLKDFIALNEK